MSNQGHADSCELMACGHPCMRHKQTSSVATAPYPSLQAVLWCMSTTCWICHSGRSDSKPGLPDKMITSHHKHGHITPCVSNNRHQQQRSCRALVQASHYKSILCTFHNTQVMMQQKVYCSCKLPDYVIQGYEHWTALLHIRCAFSDGGAYRLYSYVVVQDAPGLLILTYMHTHTRQYHPQPLCNLTIQCILQATIYYKHTTGEGT